MYNKMWDNIKKLIKQYFIIWWTVSCLVVVLFGAIYMEIQVQQKHENRSQDLSLWLLAWVFITPIGIVAGWFCWLIDATETLDNAENAMSLNGENEGFNDAEEAEHANVDMIANFNAVNICYEDGQATGQHSV